MKKLLLLLVLPLALLGADIQPIIIGKNGTATREEIIAAIMLAKRIGTPEARACANKLKLTYKIKDEELKNPLQICTIL